VQSRISQPASFIHLLQSRHPYGMPFRDDDDDDGIGGAEMAVQY
jgi:hypothetical protein